MLGNTGSVAVKHGAGQKIVYFNRQVMTDSGPAIENDIATAQVKVVLEDIPATASFRAQQLHAFTQIVQAAPPAYQAVLYPAMLELSDVPNRHALAEQLRNVGNVNPGSGQQAQALQQRFEAAMQQQAQIVSGLQSQLAETQQALVDKSRELDLKERGLDNGQDKSRTDASIKAGN